MNENPSERNENPSNENPSACVLERNHLWTALAYVERNPLRAGIVRGASDYRWSSAAAHLSGMDEAGILDMEWWRREGRGAEWAQVLGKEELEATSALRRCTYAGRPLETRVLSARCHSDSGGIGNAGGRRKRPRPRAGRLNRGISGHFFERKASPRKSAKIAQFRLTHFCPADPFLPHFCPPAAIKAYDMSILQNCLGMVVH